MFRILIFVRLICRYALHFSLLVPSFSGDARAAEGVSVEAKYRVETFWSQFCACKPVAKGKLELLKYHLGGRGGGDLIAGATLKIVPHFLSEDAENSFCTLNSDGFFILLPNLRN